MNFLRVSLTLFALTLQMQFVFSSNDNNILFFGNEKGDIVIDREEFYTDEGNVSCTLRIGERIRNLREEQDLGHFGENSQRHRRTVSVDVPLQCEKCDVIKVDIPHDGVNMSFNKVYTESMEKDFSSSHWTGSEPSSGSIFNFVQDDEGYLAASLTDMATGNVFQFHNTHGGGYAVTVTPTSEFPAEDDPLNEDDGERKRHLRRINNNDPSFLRTITQSNQSAAAPSMLDQIKKNLSEQPKRKVYDDSGSNLDVMVVWTENAECNLYGLSNGCTVNTLSERNMRAMIDLAVFETNIAYKNSNIQTELLLVHAYRHPSYVEDRFSAALSGLNIATYGIGPFVDVKDQRTAYGADLVALIIDPSSRPQCGVANLGPNINRMNSVISWTCATGYYSFGHEIGHNMGCRHDRGNMQQCHISDKYQYGWRDPTAKFRTVMAYSCKTGECDKNQGDWCPRIPYFSNLNGRYNGLPVGDARNDNARQINDVIATVAAYYPHSIVTPSPVPATSAPTHPTPAVCGNGVCEIGDGEGCGTCSDCKPLTHCNTMANPIQWATTHGKAYGIAFDVTVKSRGLYFYMLRMYMLGSTTAKIYMKNGSFKSDRDLMNWRKVYDGSVSPNSQNRASMYFSSRFYAPPGSKVAFYVSFGSGASFVYTNTGTTNNDMTLLPGDALTQQFTSVLPAVIRPSSFFFEQINYDIEPSVTPAPVALTLSPTISTSAPTASTSVPSIATSSPTASTSTPTAATTPAPSIATSSPTASKTAPTASTPTRPCVDRIDEWNIGRRTKSWCAWADKGDATEIQHRCTVKKIEKDCPVICGLCVITPAPIVPTSAPVYAPTRHCVDRPDEWNIGKKTKLWCAWASKGTTDPVEIACRCVVKKIKYDCPVTCGLCSASQGI